MEFGEGIPGVRSTRLVLELLVEFGSLGGPAAEHRHSMVRPIEAGVLLDDRQQVTSRRKVILSLRLAQSTGVLGFLGPGASQRQDKCQNANHFLYLTI